MITIPGLTTPSSVISGIIKSVGHACYVQNWLHDVHHIACTAHLSLSSIVACSGGTSSISTILFFLQVHTTKSGRSCMMWTEARRVHDANKWALSNEGHNYCRYDRHHILDILSNKQALRGQFSSRTKRD